MLIKHFIIEEQHGQQVRDSEVVHFARYFEFNVPSLIGIKETGLGKTCLLFNRCAIVSSFQTFIRYLAHELAS